MKLLILGGSGFVSGTLAEIALSQGHEVWSVTRGKNTPRPGVHALTADRNDPQALTAAIRSAGTAYDACIDCICFTREQAMTDLSVLPQFTGRLIVISTDSVYHPLHKAVPQDEDGVYLTDRSYGADKRRMEEAFIAAETPLKWTLLRPGHIYGPGSRLGCFPEHARQADLLSHMRADLPLRLLGGGTFLIHPIAAKDLCRTMLSCIPLEACMDQILCIGGPDIVPNRRYYEIIGELIGHPAVIENVPYDEALRTDPRFSGNLCDRAYSLEKLRNTGAEMPSTRLTDGLREHIAWLDAAQDA